MALADDGYFDRQEKFDTNPSTNALLNYMKETALARHETINRRLKRWGVLQQVYRHDIEEHGAYVHAIANLVQLSILIEEPPFQVEYNKNVAGLN